MTYGYTGDLTPHHHRISTVDITIWTKMAKTAQVMNMMNWAYL